MSDENAANDARNSIAQAASELLAGSFREAFAHDVMTSSAPAPAHMIALQRANAVRLARADLKRSIADGRTTVGTVILECPWEAASMTIAELLLSQRRWGATRTSKFLADSGIKETKTVGSMNDRQRRALVAIL